MKRARKDFFGRITPLFDTMIVQDSEEVGEDFDHPAIPHKYPLLINHLHLPNLKRNNHLRRLRDRRQRFLKMRQSMRKVLDLEKAKDAQAKEIATLKKRIQRLERKKMSRPIGLKRIRKVGMYKRVESSKDQESLGAPEDDDDLMSDIGVLEDDEMPVEAKVDEKDEQSTKPDDSTAGEAVTTASVEDGAAPTTIKKITLAQTLIQIKAAKPKVVTIAVTITTTIRPKARRVVVQEPSEFRVP
ncbi:hypothetical protein Tco_0364922 [Tanacetum coccineum]